MPIRVGVDVGGTHTDAVALGHQGQVLRAVKSQTTRDLITGISNALANLFSDGTINRRDVDAAMFGTTHSTNAIVERKGLSKVGVIRIGKQSSSSIPPMYTLPEDLSASVNGASVMIDGGHEYSGRQIVPMEESALPQAAERFKENGVQSIAISAVFSPVNPSHERRAAEILAGRLPGVPISLSHEIGGLGLIARENAAILNSALFRVANSAIRSFQEAVDAFELTNAKIFLTQNDGTLMNVDYARKYPVRTIACGPTNSIRGAGYLTGMSDGVVVDVGGTTALVGVISNGFPRDSTIPASIGGVRTNFRMPDVLAIGCGGGTVVHRVDGGVTIGPDSVAFELTEKALSWGGSEVTTTDIALASGYAVIDDGKCDPARLSELDSSFVDRARKKIIEIVEDAVDRMKTTSAQVPVILVGGGGIIVPPSHYSSFKGASRVVRPEMFQYANAIGAATAQVGAEVDRTFSYEETPREEVLKLVKQMCVEEAIRAGAMASSIRIVDVDEIPLTYISTSAARIRVKAVGELDLGRPKPTSRGL